MKHRGATCEINAERDKDLMKQYRVCLGNIKFISKHSLMNALVNSPSRRFWVSEERASIVVSRMKRGDNLNGMNPTKREMYKEIYKRVCKMKKEHPEMTQYDIVFEVIRQPAPKFYLTPDSCYIIITRIRKRWHQEGKQRNMHH